jgi:hypothetical protein
MLGRNSSATYNPDEPAEPNVGGTFMKGTGGGEGDGAGDALRRRSRCGELFALEAHCVLVFMREGRRRRSGGGGGHRGGE